MRRPPLAAAAIPPLPKMVGKRVVDVIQLESKGKKKVKAPKVMPFKKVEVPEVMDIKKTRFKKTRVSKEVFEPPANMETEEETTTSKKRKKRANITQ